MLNLFLFPIYASFLLVLCGPSWLGWLIILGDIWFSGRMLTLVRRSQKIETRWLLNKPTRQLLGFFMCYAIFGVTLYPFSVLEFSIIEKHLDFDAVFAFR